MANYKVEGIIFSKSVQEGINKQGKDYRIEKFVLEVKDVQYKTSNLWEFKTGWGVSLNGFDERDKVEVLFYIKGRQWETKYYHDLYAVSIRHPDIQGNDTRSLEGEPSWKKEQKDLAKTFVAPDPAEEIDDSGLPF